MDPLTGPPLQLFNYRGGFDRNAGNFHVKALSNLNKYFLKYKWHLIWGTVFTIASNLFGIFPAQLVRYALDLVRETIDI